MKGKSTIVYFGKNYTYANSLLSESTLVNLVADNGYCTEFMKHEGETVEVARDGIEGDAEFLIFEDDFLSNIFEQVYEEIEGIKGRVTGREVDTSKDDLDIEEILIRIKAHFEKNEDARQSEFARNEAQRKSSFVSLTERQGYMLSAEEQERILRKKEAEYVPQVYKRTTFEEFIDCVNDKAEALKRLKEQFHGILNEEQLLKLENGDHEVLKIIVTEILRKHGIEQEISNSFFNNISERKRLLDKIGQSEEHLDNAGAFALIERVLSAEVSEHELYAIIAEDFCESFLKNISLVELFGRNKQELLKNFVLRMQQTEKEMKKDSLINSGKRYELGEKEGYKPHVLIVSEKQRTDIDHSQVAMGYVRQSVSKQIMSRLGLSESVQLFELDSDQIEKSGQRLRDIVFSERALKDLRHGEKMSELEVISELLDLLKNQDPKIANHSLRVSNWVSIIMMLAHESKEIPKEMKVPTSEMECDVLATGLHDTGKRLAGIIRDLFGDKSDKVSFVEELGRNTSSFGKLPTDAKTAIINHSNIGAEALGILSERTDSEILDRAKDIAEKHHKSYKQKGQIVNGDSLINIVTLADCLDAIISGRSYNNVNEPMTLEGTIDILLKDMGGCIKVYREYKDERVEVRPGNWFMDESIKFHFDSQEFENATNVKFNPYFLMMALKFLRQQVIESEKGKKVHMSFNDETIAPEVKKEFEAIQDVSEVYQIQGLRESFKGKRHLVTSFTGIPMEQNTEQAVVDKSIEMKPIEAIKAFIEIVSKKEKNILRQTSRHGGDMLRA